MGCGEGVIAAGVAVAQAVSMNNVNRLLNREFGNVFMGKIGLHPILIRKRALSVSSKDKMEWLGKRVLRALNFR
jgi:hypothetical protein